MKKVAGAVLNILNNAKLEGTQGKLTAAATRVLETITDLEGVNDGVPSWLRKHFQKEVRLSWSDHLPIVLTITMLKAGDEGVEESKGN